MNSHLLDSLTLHEGFRNVAYKDTAGVWTVGYGHNLESHGVPAKYAQHVVVCRMDAEKFLREDIIDANKDAMLFPEFGLLDTVARRNVFIEMVFNLGRTRLMLFRRMLQAINDGDYDRAADEMLDSRWARQVGNRAVKLSTLMRRGTYS